MAQGFAIELYFDKSLETQVLKAWNVLSLREITRPHITLFSAPFLEPPKLQQLIKTFASNQERMPISLSSVGSFPKGGNTLFLSPTPSLPLLQLQKQLCDELEKWLDVEIGAEYCADSWVPHCIVAQDVPQNRMAESFCVLRDLELLPITGFGVDIGLVELSPATRELFSFPLGNSMEEQGQNLSHG